MAVGSLMVLVRDLVTVTVGFGGRVGLTTDVVEVGLPGVTVTVLNLVGLAVLVGFPLRVVFTLVTVGFTVTVVRVVFLVMVGLTVTVVSVVFLVMVGFGGWTMLVPLNVSVGFGGWMMLVPLEVDDGTGGGGLVRGSSLFNKREVLTIGVGGRMIVPLKVEVVDLVCE